MGALADASGRRVERAFDDGNAGAERLSASVNTLRSSFAALGVGLAVRKVVDDFRQFERGLIGVGKTADLDGAALQALGRDIDEMSQRLKVIDASELLDIAQSAGQLGVQGSANILKFTETVAKLGQASDLQGQEAATSLARILNVTDESVGSVDRLGSIIVSLGNNFAATEREIARHTNEVARATAQFEIGSTSATAFGATLAAIGVRAELGGSVIGRTFRAINDAVKGGGDEMQTLQQIVGRTADEIRSSFEANAVAAFQDFLAGLARVQRSGGNVSAALEALGLSGDEVNKVLPVLSTRTDLLAKALSLAAKEAENATALTTEFDRVLASFNAQVKGAQRDIESASRSIGEKLAPSLGKGIEATGDAALVLADNLDLVALALVGLAGRGIAPVIQRNTALAASFVQQQVAAVGAARAQVEVTAANLAGAQAQIRMAQSAAALTGSYRALGVATTNAAVAQRAHAAALAAASVQARIATAATTALRGVMAFFGGPIGLAITAVAGGYFLLSQRAEAAETATDELNRKIETQIRLMRELTSASGSVGSGAASTTRSLISAIDDQIATLEAERQAQLARFGRAAEQLAKFGTTRRRGPQPSHILADAGQQALDLQAQIRTLRGQQSALRGDLALLQSQQTAQGDDPATPFASLDEEAAKAMERIAGLTQGLRDQIRVLEAEKGERDQVRAIIEAENIAREGGIALLPQQRAQIEALTGEIAALETQEQLLADTQEELNAITQKFFQDGKAVAEAARTPLEIYNDEIERLNDLLTIGAISTTDFARTQERLREELRETDKALQEQQQVAESFAVGLTGAFRDLIGDLDDFQSALQRFGARVGNIFAEEAFFKPLQERLAELLGPDGLNIAEMLSLSTRSGAPEEFPPLPIRRPKPDVFAGTGFSLGDPSGTEFDFGVVKDSADALAATLDTTAVAAGSAGSGLDFTSAAGLGAGDVLGNTLVNEALNSAVAAAQEAAASTTVTGAMTQLTAAAQAAAQALAEVAASAAGGGGGGSLGFLGSLFGSSGGSIVPGTPATAAIGPLSTAFGFAGGGDPPVGVPSIVGEQGPELIVPKVPSRVFSNAQTRAMLASSDGSGMGALTLNMSVTINGRLTAAERAEAMMSSRMMGEAAVDSFRDSVNRGGADAHLTGRRRGR